MGKRAKRTTTIETDGTRFVQEDNDVDGDPDVPRQYVSFDELVSDGRERYDDDCWGCKYAFKKPKKEGDYPIIDSLWKTFSENRGTMAVKKLAELISFQHETLCYLPLLKAGDTKCSRWTPDSVFRHLTKHMRDPRTDLELRNDKLFEAEETLGDMLRYREEGNPQIGFDLEMFDAFLRAGKRKEEVMAKLQKLTS